jgi:hypothetical protein
LKLSRAPFFLPGIPATPRPPLLQSRAMNDEPKLALSQRRWSQFTVRDLFWAMTLLAAGIGGMVWVFSEEMRGWGDLAWGLVRFYGSAMLIGAGLLSPIRQKYLGAVLGLGLPFLASALMNHSEAELLAGLLGLAMALAPWLLWRWPRR